MPIIYDKEKFQAINRDTKTSLTHFQQERDYGYYLLEADGEMFMVSLTIGFSNHSVTNEEYRRHTLYIQGFSHVNPKDIGRVYEQELEVWRNQHSGRFIHADYKPYKDVIISHLRVLKSYGHSLSEWPNEIIIDFSRLDESLKQGEML